MSEAEFAGLCAGLFAVYEPLIKVWSGALAGTGMLAGVVIGLMMSFRHTLG
jgi:hypothetical protein